MRITRTISLTVAAMALLLATLVIVTPAPARAQSTCQQTTLVNSEAELLAAVNCYNAQTPAVGHLLRIGRDITLTAPLPAVAASGSGLNIEGRGNRIIVPSTLDIASAFAVIDSGVLRVRDLQMDMSGNLMADAIAVQDGSLAIFDSVITNAAVGIRVVNGTLNMGRSAFQGNEQALLQVGGIVSVSDSTIAGQAMSGRGFRQVGGQALVVNSTLSDLQVAIEASTVDADVDIRLQNSTVARNSSGLDGPGSITVESSLVAAHELQDCSDTVDTSNAGGSFDSDGTCGFALIDASALGDLADNGCSGTTPLGCKRTHAIIATGPWVNGGTCTDVPFLLLEAGSPFIGELIDDQRGFTRSLQGRCDAGAFESNLVPTGPLCAGVSVTINMLEGDSGIGTSANDVILGTAGDDMIDAGDGDDIVCAGAGNDVVVAGDGDDTVFGSSGQDIIRGNPGSDTIDGGAGNDRLLGGIGNDDIDGGDGNDFIGGFGGDDRIFGGPGDETIFGGFGADLIDGGPGDDIIRGLIGDDRIFGGAGDDQLDGDRGNDTILGDDGDDVIRGGNANDVLDGGPGNDSVSGGKADDTLSGGLDTDICTGNLQTVADTADNTCETILGVP